MRLATFVPETYEPTNAHPRRGRCCSARCRARATIELTAAAGPEGGDIRPNDPAQVLVRRGLCSRHAPLWRRDADAYGPDFEVDHESVWRADRLLGDPTYKQRQRVVDFVRDALRAEAWRVLGGDVARETRRGELEREIASASEDVARLRAELAAAEAREAAARAEMAALSSAAAA